MRFSLDNLRGRDVLLVASTGGHLQQLTRLAPRLGLGAGSEWLTFDTPQSRTLLDGQQVHFVPYVRPRDWRGIARASWLARSLRDRFDGSLSTGAGLALSVLPFMAAAGKPSVYIESISRVLGPSASGRILSHLPRVGVYAQHDWSYGPWRPGPSVLADYERIDSGEYPTEPQRVFVTLGTIKPYRFDRLVDTVAGYIAEHPDTEVRWQVGCTERHDLGGDVHRELGAEQFHESIAWADVVVAHAGVGIAMNILDAGKVPVLLARQPEFGEHVDAHQQQIHDFLVERDLALNAEEAFANPTQLRRLTASRVERAA